MWQPDENLDPDGKPRARHGWGIRGTLKHQRHSEPIVSLQQEFGEAGVYTVQFGIIRPTNTLFAVRAVANIFWTVNGNTLQRQVVVGDGMAISGLAEAVLINVNDDSPTTLPDPADYDVTILVTKGCRPTNQNQPFLSLNTGTVLVSAGTDTDVTIPANIGVNAAFMTPFTVGAGTIIPAQMIRAEQRRGTSLFAESDVLLSQWIPIFPGAQILRFHNYGAFDVRVTLAWGIDG